MKRKQQGEIAIPSGVMLACRKSRLLIIAGWIPKTANQSDLQDALEAYVWK